MNLPRGWIILGSALASWLVLFLLIGWWSLALVAVAAVALFASVLLEIRREDKALEAARDYMDGLQ